MSMVYVIESADGYAKVGVSANPSSRLASLQTANPNKLTLCNFIDLTHVPEVNAYEVERLAHSYMRLFRVQGEWFKTSRRHVALSVDRAIWEIYRKDTLARWRRRWKQQKDALPKRLVWFSLYEGQYTMDELTKLITEGRAKTPVEIVLPTVELN